MREWKFENGIEVKESSFSHELSCFKVYHEERFLGTVYAEDIDEMQAYLDDLNSGKDPISAGWTAEDGHPCTLAGWGYEA